MSSATASRLIELAKQEYTFPFDYSSGARAHCTMTEGEGTVTLYEIVQDDNTDSTRRQQIGETYALSTKPASVNYVELKTANTSSKWELVFRGTGKILLEFPDRLLSPSKKGKKGGLSNEYDRKTGRRKEQP